MQCLILAGGLGTRMQGFDSSVPKALLPVAGYPFAHWQLSWLASEGVDVVYSIGYRGDMIRDYVGNGGRWGVSVRFVEETDGLLGTGGAVRLAVDEGTVSERFFVLYGDAYLRIRLGLVDERFRNQQCEALMTVFENHGRWDESNVVFHDGMVLEYSKGSPRQLKHMRYIDYGISEMESALVEECIPPGEPYDLADFFSLLSREGRLCGFEASDRFFEVGSPEGLRDLEHFLAEENRAT